MRLCGGRQAARTGALASYTVKRVLERLERDQSERTLSPEARSKIARATVEELVAVGAIDSANRILDTLREEVARLRNKDVLGYGFLLVERDEPGANEWRALRDDPRLFCVRFSTRGFAVFQAGADRARFYSPAGWGDVAPRTLMGVRREN